MRYGDDYDRCHMKRRLLNLLTALSLLAFVAVCVLWVRSHFVNDEVARWGGIRARGSDSFILESDAGTLLLEWRRFTFPSTDQQVFAETVNRVEREPYFSWYASRYSDGSYYERYRESFRRKWFGATSEHKGPLWGSNGITLIHREVRLPHGVVAAALLVFPGAVASRRFRARSRRRDRLCPY
jgi:hypothetical protein